MPDRPDPTRTPPRPAAAPGVVTVRPGQPPPPPRAVRPSPRRAPSARLTTRLAWLPGAVVATAASLMGLTLVGLALGARSIIDPRAPDWLGQVLPGWITQPVGEGERTVTLAQIRALVAEGGLLASDPLELLGGDWLLVPATLIQRPCAAGGPECQAIVQLRLYHHKSGQTAGDRGKLYQLATVLPVEGPEKVAALAPFGAKAAAELRPNRPLPLTRVAPMARSAPNGGQWLNLTGQYEGKTASTRYGLLVYFNPDRAYLSAMLPWTSPRGVDPFWRTATQDPHPQLLVDQSTDLAANLAIYRLLPYDFAPNPRRFEAIALAQPALDRPDYRNALNLAKAGLWSPALSRLSALADQQARAGRPLPEAARTQLNLIRENAALAQARADSPQGDRGVQIPAALLDGRWQRAIDLFRAAGPLERSGALRRLRHDSAAIWQRIDAYLALDPRDPGAKLWGAISLAVSENRSAALVWYGRQAGNSADLDRQVSLEISRALAARDF